MVKFTGKHALIAAGVGGILLLLLEVAKCLHEQGVF